jgi:hypothetical protein
MSGKNQAPITLGPNAPIESSLPQNSPGLSWQTTNPQIGFLPLTEFKQGQGSFPSGLLNGVMSGTNTIYTQIVDVSRVDNLGLEIFWTGTPTGTISYWASDSGINFFTVSLTTSQPSGSAGGFGVNLNQWPYKYLQLQYTNSSGSGIINAYMQIKDLN